jgi:hypothetical protein
MKYVVHKIPSVIVAPGIPPALLMEAKVNILRESLWLKPTLEPTDLFQVKAQFIVKWEMGYFYTRSLVY